MCRDGCEVNPETKRCYKCNTHLTQIMQNLKVPRADQDDTWKTLVYHQYQ